MYPGIASKKNIPAKKTAVMCFKDELQQKDTKPSLSIPAVNISETVAEYIIVIASPGLHREDFSIEVTDSVITIAAKKEIAECSQANDRCEYDYTDWTRAFTLPTDTDALLASAEYKNGELIIHIPRSNTGENQSKITIYVY